MRQARNLLTIFPVVLLAGAVLVVAADKPKAKKPLADYNAVVVEKFSIEETQKTVGFSQRMLEGVRGEVIDRLQAERLFAKVIDAAPAAAPPASPEASKPAESTATPSGGRLLLSGTVIEFGKGSRTKRALFGILAGASKVKVRFIFRDAQTGTELLRTERGGKYRGLLGLAGGDEKYAVEEAAGDVVDGLIKDIKKHR